MDFIEKDDKGSHIKVNVTPAIHAAAEKGVDAAQALSKDKGKGLIGFKAKEELGNMVALLRGAVRKDNPELPAQAFGIDERSGEKQHMRKASRRLYRDMLFAVNDTLNVLLKEIAESKGVEAPVLNTSHCDPQSNVRY